MSMHTECATCGNANLAITRFQLQSPHRSSDNLRLYRVRVIFSAAALPANWTNGTT